MNKIANLIGSSATQLDPLSIAVRGYVPTPKKTKRSWGKPSPASEWTLVFDTETSVDAAQRLRIGAMSCATHTHRQDYVRIFSALEEIAQNVVGNAPDKGDNFICGGLVL
jgi:hypothetical protein